MAWPKVIPAILFSLLIASTASAQRTTQTNSVSRDLLAIYEQTKVVGSEAEVTELARACAKIVPDPRRTQADRSYAASLLGWALNRRGEMRSQRAAELVVAGQIAEAANLDQLAARDFETALEHSPDNWRMHHNFAIALAMKGDYPRAIDEFTQAIALNDSYANAYFNRAELHFELQDYAAADRDYSQALAIDAADPQYYNSRGHARFMLGDYPPALSDYQKATGLDSDNAVYHTDLADAFQFLGQWEQAAAAYRSAIARDGQYARAYQNASWLMATCPDEKFRNRDLAVSTARKALELAGDTTARALETIAAAVAATGDFDEAITLQREAVGLAETDEREEMSQRLQLYQARRGYTQPRPMTVANQPSATAVQTARSTEASGNR